MLKIKNFPKFTLFKKWPSKSQWSQFFAILSKKEKLAFLLFLILFFGSSIFLIFNFYYKNTEKVAANGGTFVEGLVGSPRFINPIYGEIYDIDRDLLQFIFSGLMKYNKDGKIVPDLIGE